MNFITKSTIAALALTSMIQADTMLLGVDGGLTIGGARLGVVAGITGGSARNYTAPGYSAYQRAGAACGSVAYAQPVVYAQPVYTNTTVATTSYRPVYNTTYKPVTTVSYKPVYNTTYQPQTTVSYQPTTTYRTYAAPVCTSTCYNNCCY